jgi:hypothetical protein
MLTSAIIARGAASIYCVSVCVFLCVCLMCVCVCVSVCG